MNINQQYQTLSKKNDSIILITGLKVEIQEYVRNSYKRYRFNTTKSMMERQGSKCNTWYKVLLCIEGEWSDVHNESEYHFATSKTGFGSYCIACSSKHTSSKNNQLVKYSVFLTKENLRYIAVRCAAMDIRKTDFINELIAQERLKNSLAKFI